MVGPRTHACSRPFHSFINSTFPLIAGGFLLSIYLSLMKTIKIISEQSNEPSLKVVSKLFKLLNEEKKKNKTRASLLEAIKNFTPYLGIPEGYSQVWCEV
jgi:hypothetical protein